MKPFEDLMLEEDVTRDQLVDAWKLREMEKKRVLDQLAGGEYVLVTEEDREY